MDEIQTQPVVGNIRRSEYIKLRPSANLHHGIRLAEAIGRPLNLFVTINFSLTRCEPDSVSYSFCLLRDKFGKWLTRPPRRFKEYKAPPTYVWSIENPPSGSLNAHWLVHVPSELQKTFQQKLVHWLSATAGEILCPEAVHIQEAPKPRGVGKYMLKGLYPGIAPRYGIRPSDQGWVTGKRSGFSKNIGPTQKRRLRKIGKYPPARQYIPF